MAGLFSAERIRVLETYQRGGSPPISRVSDREYKRSFIRASTRWAKKDDVHRQTDTRTRMR